MHARLAPFFFTSLPHRLDIQTLHTCSLATSPVLLTCTGGGAFAVPVTKSCAPHFLLWAGAGNLRVPCILQDLACLSKSSVSGREGTRGVLKHLLISPPLFLKIPTPPHPQIHLCRDLHCRRERGPFEGGAGGVCRKYVGVRVPGGGADKRPGGRETLRAPAGPLEWQWFCRGNLEGTARPLYGGSQRNPAG
jgi:hypothetical protein